MTLRHGLKFDLFGLAAQAAEPARTTPIFTVCAWAADTAEFVSECQT